jgi:hypothetical protein
MIWLENLARDTSPPAVPPLAVGSAVETRAEPAADELSGSPREGKPRKRRGKNESVVDQEESTPPMSAVPPSQAKDDSMGDWVDLLRPLD